MNRIFNATDCHVDSRCAWLEETQVTSGDILAEEEKGLWASGQLMTIDVNLSSLIIESLLTFLCVCDFLAVGEQLMEAAIHDGRARRSNPVPFLMSRDHGTVYGLGKRS